MWTFVRMFSYTYLLSAYLIGEISEEGRGRVAGVRLYSGTFDHYGSQSGTIPEAFMHTEVKY